MTPVVVPPRARVLIVEDHPIFRERVAELVNKEPDMEVCGETDNIQRALELLRSATPPDVVVLDITLRTSNGLELLKQTRAENITTPALVLSMHDDTLYAERSLRAGARGYVNKIVASAGIINAIRRVLAGEIVVSNNVASRIMSGLATGRASLTGVTQLTDRELEIFELIGRGRTTREIGSRLRLGTTTIDTYRARIKSKLQLQNTSQLTHEAVRWVQSLQQGG
jgi:DNA-binding NarL/FixJ family response regulator